MGGLAALLLYLPAAATPATRSIKLSTWNLEWLLDQSAPASQNAPADIPPRTVGDYALLAAYAAQLHPDLAALQETDSARSISRIFSPHDYSIFITDDRVLQHPALALRTGLATTTRHPDLRELDTNPPGSPHHLRSGLDMTVHFAHADLRVLVVHLKTGCWDDPPEQTRHACPLLAAQFRALAQWVRTRTQSGEAFAIMGDFNRRLTASDPFFLTLQENTRLDLVTSGLASPCLGGSYFIDHIILGGPAMGWKDPASLSVMPIPQGQGLQLSDHCPVSITLHIPT